MQRRTFLHTLLAGAGGVALGGRLAHAALPKMKITRVRYYSPGKEARAGVPSLTSSANVICIDTDAGLTGIGEGGTKDTLEHCASALIGQDPGRIDTLWQNMFRGAFYPAGLEKLHALGGLDMALWDIKGKALGVPFGNYSALAAASLLTALPVIVVYLIAQRSFIAGMFAGSVVE